MTAIKGFVAVVLIALLASFFLFSSHKEERLFTQEKVEHYRLAYQQKVFDFSLSARPVPTYIDLKAGLYLRVISIDPDEVSCAVQLHDVDLSLTPANPDLTSRLTAYYERSVSVLFYPDGRIKSLTFPGLESNYVGYRQLMQQLEMVIKSKMRYRVTQDDSLGEYEAQYRWQDEKLHRHKIGYLNVQGADEIRLYQSNATITLSAGVNWYHHFDAHERLRLLQDGKKLLQVQTEISLEYLDSNSSDYAYVDTRELQRQQEDDADLYQALEKEELERLFSEERYDLQKLLAQIEASPDNIKNYLLLEAYLQLHPEEIPALYDPLKEADRSVSRDLIGMLETLQLEASQKLLSRLTLDAEARTLDRTRAIIALAAQQEPTEETKSTLSALVVERQDEVDNDLANTALLALGALSRDHSSSMQESETLIHRALQEADNYNDAKVALLAAKNSGVERYIESIIPYLSSDDPRLRTRAVTLLRPYRELDKVQDAITSLPEGEVSQEVQGLLNTSERTADGD